MQTILSSRFRYFCKDLEEKGIQINGLIWMGTHDEMLRRIDEKLEAGFRCIKIKIGAINFDTVSKQV